MKIGPRKGTTSPGPAERVRGLACGHAKTVWTLTAMQSRGLVVVIHLPVPGFQSGRGVQDPDRLHAARMLNFVLSCQLPRAG